jgi:putative FmdB family regulatory protein
MPLYEYHCKKCDNKFEALVSFKNADGAIKCPDCDSEETSRLLSTFAAGKSNSSEGCASRDSCSSAGT